MTQLVLLVLFTGISARADFPRALVYRGPGACDEGCSYAAAEVARAAGLQPEFVGPSERDPRVFEGSAVVWIQPGGKSSIVAREMVPELKSHLKAFVARGGGYVGFCAGGFLATRMIAERGIEGLGLLPGTNSLYGGADEPTLLPIRWNGIERHLYWEGGPSFVPPPADPSVQVTAYYPDGSVASLRAPYGAGRVYVTGLHPEAPQSWRDYFGQQDPDGLDQDLAIEMVLWASNQRGELRKSQDD